MQRILCFIGQMVLNPPGKFLGAQAAMD